MYFMLLIYMPILYQIFEMYQIIQQSTVVEGVIDIPVCIIRFISNPTLDSSLLEQKRYFGSILGIEN